MYDRYWLEAERSEHKVGGAQKESESERKDALARGKAVSSVIGTRAMGTRFNVLMTIQLPLQQKKQPERQMMDWGCEAESCSEDEDWGDDGCRACSEGDAIFDVDDGCRACSDDEGADECAGGMWDDLKECVAMASCAAPAPRMRNARGSSPKVGRSNAARVSRGSEVDVWDGLTVEEPERNKSEHVTITVVIYNTCEGGVPSEADVVAAIDDLEALYDSCGARGNLAGSMFDFMKEKLTVDDIIGIKTKVAAQPPPFVPPSDDVVGYSTFPT